MKLFSRKNIFLSIGAVLLIVLIGIGVYINTPYRAKSSLTDLQNEYTHIQFEDTPSYIKISKKEGNSQTGYIFYPGGRVAPESYLQPYTLLTDETGSPVWILKVPLNFAILQTDGAEQIMKQNPEIISWNIGGHSLGGVAASTFVGKNLNNQKIKGLFLCGSYPADNGLKSATISVVSVFGAQDGFVKKEKIDSSKALLPDSAKFVKIHGMNHSQCGDYGLQDGDNVPDIFNQNAWAEQVTAYSFKTN